MKKLTTVLLTSLMIFGTAACSSNIGKTSANTSDQPGVTTNAPNQSEAQQDLSDAQSQIRRNQLNEDIQAREQRNDFLNNGSAENRPDSDLASEVRDKLEANLPEGELTVESQQGIITVGGIVPTQEQLVKIKPLAEQIKGVRGVKLARSLADVPSAGSLVNVEANIVTANSNQSSKI